MSENNNNKEHICIYTEEGVTDNIEMIIIMAKSYDMAEYYFIKHSKNKISNYKIFPVKELKVLHTKMDLPGSEELQVYVPAKHSCFDFELPVTRNYLKSNINKLI